MVNLSDKYNHDTIEVRCTHKCRNRGMKKRLSNKCRKLAGINISIQMYLTIYEYKLNANDWQNTFPTKSYSMKFKNTVIENYNNA